MTHSGISVRFRSVVHFKDLARSATLVHSLHTALSTNVIRSRHVVLFHQMAHSQAMVRSFYVVRSWLLVLFDALASFIDPWWMNHMGMVQLAKRKRDRRLLAKNASVHLPM